MRDTAGGEECVSVRAPLENPSLRGVLPRGRHAKDKAHEVLSILLYAFDASLVSGNEV